MNGTQFDTMSQRLTAGESRRRLVGGLLGGAAAALTGATVLEAAKGGNGKGKGKNNGNGNGNGKTKVFLCHKPNSTTGAGSVLEVSSSAKGGSNKKGKLRGHLRHGDVECPVVAGVTYVNGGTCTVTGGVAECQVVATAS